MSRLDRHCGACKATPCRFTDDQLNHGTTGYGHGCRCDTCVTERRNYRGSTHAAPVRDDGIVDEVIVERLCQNPNAWREGLRATPSEKRAAGRILGAWSHKALGISGSDAKRVTA